MAKVGRFITDPRVGAYCQVTLDSGEKLVVNHDTASREGGRLTIEVSKLLGFSSERIFTCDLGTPEGRPVLAALTRPAEPGSPEANPLGALVRVVKDCRTVADVKARCAVLASGG